MPIYEYQCDACGYQFEVIQRMSDPPLTDCPSCAANQVRKLVSAAAFHLKGTGWYETDFKNKGKPAKKDDKDTNAKSDAPAKSETKSTSASSSPASD